jgi:Helix-turn-helix domain of resolvase
MTARCFDLRETPVDTIAQIIAETVTLDKLKRLQAAIAKQISARKLKAEGLGATEIAARLKVGRASVYRVLASSAPAATPDALTLALSSNPQFKVLPPSGKGFTIPQGGR